MKKLMIRNATILGLLVVITIGFYYHKVHRIHNIFDEIYYEEDDYRSVEQLFRKRAFSKIKDIKFYDNNSEDFYQHRVDYQESQLPRNITSLSYSFHFSDSKVPYFILEIRKKTANADSTINMNYQYFPENKTFRKKYVVF